MPELPKEDAAWVGFAKSRPGARARLVCFHHAGGAASAYQAWLTRLPDDLDLVAIQLPGRESRYGEPPFRKVRPLVAELARALRPLFDLPVAFFGHSMGATLAFELAHALREARGPQPFHLAVSGRGAPHLPRRGAVVSELSDPGLVGYLRTLGGLPVEVESEPDLLELVLRVVRTDYALVDDFVLEPRAPLTCPISAFYGDADPIVDAAEARAWEPYTTSRFAVRGFGGDHFFIAQSRDDVIGSLVSEVRASLER